MPIIGNGDIHSPEDALRMLETGCDGVMIGRAAMHDPWIFRRIRHFLDHGEYPPEPDLNERIDVCLRHLGWMVDFYGERTGVIEFRKRYPVYLKGLPGSAKARADMNAQTSHAAVVARMERFRADCPIWIAEQAAWRESRSDTLEYPHLSSPGYEGQPCSIN